MGFGQTGQIGQIAQNRADEALCIAHEFARIRNTGAQSVLAFPMKQSHATRLAALVCTRDHQLLLFAFVRIYYFICIYLSTYKLFIQC